MSYGYVKLPEDSFFSRKKQQQKRGNQSIKGDKHTLNWPDTQPFGGKGPLPKNRLRRLLRFSNTSMTRMAKELSKVGHGGCHAKDLVSFQAIPPVNIGHYERYFFRCRHFGCLPPSKLSGSSYGIDSVVLRFHGVLEFLIFFIQKSW